MTKRVLKNARHERFAQNKAKGMSIGPAYTAAGYKAKDHSAEVNGARLLKNAEVQNRIAELQNRAAEKTGYTIVKATAELEDARRVRRIASVRAAEGLRRAQT